MDFAFILCFFLNCDSCNNLHNESCVFCPFLLFQILLFCANHCIQYIYHTIYTSYNDFGTQCRDMNNLSTISSVEIWTMRVQYCRNMSNVSNSILFRNMNNVITVVQKYEQCEIQCEDVFNKKGIQCRNVSNVPKVSSTPLLFKSKCCVLKKILKKILTRNSKTQLWTF